MNDNTCAGCQMRIVGAYDLRLGATHVQPNRTCFEGVQPDMIVQAAARSWSAASLVGIQDLVVSLSIRLTALPGLDMRVRKPIPVELSLSDGIWTASQDDLDLCATGETPEDAQLSLAEYISEDFRHWRRTPIAQLSDDAKALLTKYQEYVALATD